MNEILNSNADRIKAIAEGYTAADDEFMLTGASTREGFKKLINAQFSEISKTIYFDFVASDPYEYVHITDLYHDFRQGIIKVNTSGNNSKLWGPFYNLQFRAIHDWIHCVHSLDFNFRNEVTAYNKQVEYSLIRFRDQFNFLDSDMYKRVLRSEIIYQAAVKEHFDTFHVAEQKIILKDL